MSSPTLRPLLPYRLLALGALVLGLAACPRATPTLSLITITPDEVRLPKGGTQPFAAVGLYSDGSTRLLTDAAHWTIDDEFVATLDATQPGLVQGLREGRTTIRAQVDGVSSTREFSVYPAVVARLEFDPPHPVIPIGLGLNLRVVGVRTDDTTFDATASVVWSSVGSAASVSGAEQPGRVTAVQAGTTVVQVSMDGVSASATVTVTNARVERVAVSPWGPVVVVGLHQSLRAAAALSDGSSLDVTPMSTWSSSDQAVAFVSNVVPEQGLLYARAIGAAVITARVAGLEASTPVTVTAAPLVRLEVTPTAVSVARGTSTSLVATGVFGNGSTADLSAQVRWSSSDEAVAVVSAQGRVSGLVRGQAQVSAEFGGLVTVVPVEVTAASLDGLEVAPVQASLARGTSVLLGATGRFSDGTTQDLTAQAIWASNDATAVSVSNAAGTQGLVRAQAEGQAIVTARLQGLTAQATISVTAATLEGLQLEPVAPSMQVGGALQLVLTGRFSDGTRQDLTDQASFVSSAPPVVSVSTLGLARGQLTAHAEGVATITGSFGGASATTTVLVSASPLRTLAISPAALDLPLGVVSALTLTGTFADGSTRDLTGEATWSTQDVGVATVSNTRAAPGLLTPVAPGQTVVTAWWAGHEATATVVVRPAALRTLELAPAAPSAPVGGVATLSAVGHYSDGTTQALSTGVSWSSSAPGVAAISNAAGSEGRVTALAVGTTTVTASAGAVGAQVVFTVTPATLVSLALSPGAPSLPAGATLRLLASGVYTDGSVRDLSEQATWASGDAALVSVSNVAGAAGTLRGLRPGTATISATVATTTASLTVTVTPAALVRLELSPPALTLPAGSSARLTATAVYTDAATVDVSAQAAWASSAGSVASVSSAAGQWGLVTGLAPGSGTVGATFGGQSASVAVTVTPAALARLSVSPASASRAALTTVAFRAWGTWTDGTSRDVTAQVSWAAVSPAVASLANVAPRQGLATALIAGTTAVTATLDGVQGAASLTVTPATLASLELAPPAPSAAAGVTVPLTATGHFSDGTTQDLTAQVSWSSGDATLVQVSNAWGSEGLATALRPGAVTITAAALGRSAGLAFTVTAATLLAIEVAPGAPQVPVGRTQALAAIGTFTDGTTQDLTDLVTWASSAPAQASVSNAAGSRGRVTALAVGLATITAVHQGQTGRASVTVVPAQLASVAVTPPSARIPRGLSATLAATGTWTDGSTRDVTDQATWATSDAAVATVSNGASSRGVVQAVGLGATTVTATLAGLSAQAAVTVTPAALVSLGVSPAQASLPVGLVLPLSATGVYSDGSVQDVTGQVSWSSIAPTVATVSGALGSQGLARGLAVGTTTIWVTLGGVVGSTQLIITPATLQQVQVTPNAPSLAAGLSLQLTATGIYSDGSTQDLSAQATFASSDSGTASVSNAPATHGRLTAVKPGTATVTATAQGTSGQVLVTVTAAVLQQVQVTPANGSAPMGLTQAFVATGLYSDGTTQDLSTQVTWTSSNPALLQLSNAAGSEGLGTTLAQGPVVVTATRLGISGSTPFTVTAATLRALAVTPQGVSAPLGTVRQLQAVGTYTDGSTQVHTAAGAWSSSDPTVVDLSNAVGSEGLATTVGLGVATVTVAYGGLSATTTVTVTQAALAAIDLLPSAGSTALGFTRQFVALGSYTDGTSQMLTAVATWSSSDPGKAFVSNAAASHGLLSTVALGTVTISATYQGITGSTTHTITAAALVSLAVTPGAPTVAVGATVQLTATGTFSDGSTAPLTTSVTWTSSNGAVAQVSNAAGSQGLVSALAHGTATLTATSGGVSKAVTVTVP